MINWLFIPTWSLIVLLFVAIAWIIWNFDKEFSEMQDEIGDLKRRIRELERESNGK